MRRLIFGCLMLGGCLVKDNPAWEGSAADASTIGLSGEASSTTGSSWTPTTGAEATTGGTGTDSQGPPTTGAVSATTSTTSTGEVGSSTGEASSTGPAAAECLATELVQVPTDQDDLWDAGVVPSTMGSPCPWAMADEPDCGGLNFGKTGFFRLVNDPNLGKSAALLRFNDQAVIDFISEQQYEPKDLVGARLELVVWEPLAQPTEDSTLEIGLLVGDEAYWDEGGRDAKKAQENDSSAVCRTIDGQGCNPWPAGDALASGEPIGLLLVTTKAAMDADQDALPDQYHAKLRSEPLGAELVEALVGGKQPSFLVSLSTPRALNAGVIGIKLEESSEADPELYLELCTQWSR